MELSGVKPSEPPARQANHAAVSDAAAPHALVQVDSREPARDGSIQGVAVDTRRQLTQTQPARPAQEPAATPVVAPAAESRVAEPASKPVAALQVTSGPNQTLVAEASPIAYDIATTSVKGVAIPVQFGEDPPQLCNVGKAFLMSPQCKGWHGTCYPNRPPAPQTVLGLRDLDARIRQADTARQSRNAAWRQTLQRGMQADKVEALRNIGRGGDSTLLPMLDRTMQDPSLHAAAMKAARKVRATAC